MRLEHFQMIDRIVAISLDDRTIRTEASVPASSTIFEGHFPGYPLMPGVLLIETMAQSCGWLIIAMTQFGRMPFLASVKNAKLRRFVSPGEHLSVEANLVHEGSGYAVFAARIGIENKRVCDAELTLRIMPFPNEEFRGQMEMMARRLEFPMETLTHG